jgi:hypothetical protein
LNTIGKKMKGKKMKRTELHRIFLPSIFFPCPLDSPARHVEYDWQKHEGQKDEEGERPLRPNV